MRVGCVWGDVSLVVFEISQRCGENREGLEIQLLIHRLTGPNKLTLLTCTTTMFTRSFLCVHDRVRTTQFRKGLCLRAAPANLYIHGPLGP